MQKSAALESMRAGKPPASEEEWKELAEFLATIARFMHIINMELDASATALTVMEKVIEVIADTHSPETKALLKEVVVSAYQSGGVPVSEVQDEDDIIRPEGPGEFQGGGDVSQEG